MNHRASAEHLFVTNVGKQRAASKQQYSKIEVPGGLAQLGERQAGSLKVTGSIPVSSTTLSFFPAALLRLPSRTSILRSSVYFSLVVQSLLPAPGSPDLWDLECLSAPPKTACDDSAGTQAR